jgi:hypothetical protein
VIDFTLQKDDKVRLAAEMFKRACSILTTESIEFDKKVVAEVVKKYFPDNRRVLNELQKYGSCGTIDTGILQNVQDVSIKNLTSALKEKNFTGVRKWVAQNSDTDSSEIFRTIYDGASEFLTNASIPQLVLILADYQYKSAFVADPEINMTACLTEIMVNCEFA